MEQGEISDTVSNSALVTLLRLQKWGDINYEAGDDAAELEVKISDRIQVIFPGMIHKAPVEVLVFALRDLTIDLLGLRHL